MFVKHANGVFCRRFLEFFGCSCCSLILPSCSTVPITERKQLSIIPESRINRQAASAYEKFRLKTKLITKGSKLDEIRERLTIQDAMLHESNGLEPDPRWPITMKRWNQTDMIYGKNYYRF